MSVSVQPIEPPKTQKDVQRFQCLLKQAKSIEAQKQIFQVLLPISCPHHFFRVEEQWYYWFAPTAEVQVEGLRPSIEKIYGHNCEQYQANLEGYYRLNALANAFMGVCKQMRREDKEGHEENKTDAPTK
jgi:hypothetical protein